MAPTHSRFASFDHDTVRSARNLQAARSEALKSRNYQSAPMRAKLRAEFIARNNGMVPYDWQIDVSEALLLGIDCTVIAGTGAGKSMPFVMPLFVETNKVVVIISPLNALEVDQAERYSKMALTAVAVNGDTYNKQIHKEIEQFTHRVIITSPDMCLKHDHFRGLLSSPKFAEKIAAFVIDKAHCISQWGDDFRPVYAQLGTLRAFVPLHVPFLVTSATLPPPVLAQVRATTHIQADSSYHVNLGIDRPNIAWFVRMMKGGKSDLEALAFLIPTRGPNGMLTEELIQTMIFFDDINIAEDAMKWIRNHLPPELRGQIAVYNSRRSRRSKDRVIKEFREGKIKNLLTTEAAGMGCDISNVERVVQFMVPGSLSIWVQRAGRAGRNPLVAAQVFILVQPTVFQEIKPRKGFDVNEGDSPKYRKDIEEGLWMWIETEECRREVADEYFGVGLVRKAPLGICCDNCLRKTTPDHPLLTAQMPTVTVLSRPISPSSDIEDSPSQSPDENGKRPMAEAATVRNRRDSHLQGARDLLVKWRYDTWMVVYPKRPWGLQCLLPDPVVTALATKARLDTVEHLVGAGWSPTHARRHGNDLLKLLGEYDTVFYQAREADKLEKVEKKKKEAAARKEQKREADKVERARQREIRQKLPKLPRPSRAKKRPVLMGSNVPNVTPPRLPVAFQHTGHENIPPTPLIASGTPIPFDHYTALATPPMARTVPGLAPSHHATPYPAPAYHPTQAPFEYPLAAPVFTHLDAAAFIHPLGHIFTHDQVPAQSPSEPIEFSRFRRWIHSVPTSMSGPSGQDGTNRMI